MAVISAQGLRKTYKVRRDKGFLRRDTHLVEALKGVSFEIAEGELVGYIGPNGAGKSTTVKILSGILVPDGGSCTVLGLCPWKDRRKYASRIGVVFGQRSQLWWDLPVKDSFSLLRDIYRVGEADYRSSLDELTDRLNLAELMEIPVRQLSLGQRMKCELAASLLHRPRVLFLDEPTIGLDASTKIAVRAFIRQINRERGVTAILTTHDMADVESLCDRVMLIAGGEKLLDGDIASLRRGRDERILTCRMPDGAPLPSLCAKVNSVEMRDGLLTVRFDPEAVPAARLIAEIDEKCGVRDVTVRDRPIEQVVAQMYAEISQGEKT